MGYGLFGGWPVSCSISLQRKNQNQGTQEIPEEDSGVKIMVGLRKTALGIAVGVAVLLSAAGASAAPILTLDAPGGTAQPGYLPGTTTVIAPGTLFLLTATLNPNGAAGAELSALLSDVYYIAAAVAPEVQQPGLDLGSFNFSGYNGTVVIEQTPGPIDSTIDVTGDMLYGNPPVDAVMGNHYDSGDLNPHSIYSTYYTQFGFQFSQTPNAAGHYTANFLVDTGDLAPDHVMHFDLYSTTAFRNGDVDAFPFSKTDVESSAPVPEPTSLLLLSSGLFAAARTTRRIRKAKAQNANV